MLMPFPPTHFVNFTTDKMDGNVHTIQGKGHGNAGRDNGELANQSGLLIVQRNHLNDFSAFTGSKMQSIAVCC